MTGRPSVVVVGAGIVGASLACHLASAGAAVTIIERAQPASGVTARSFAWINIGHRNAPVLAQLRNLAMAPVVGRLATGEIVAGNEAGALAPCRLSRFG